jgi:hypothetical protein
MFQEWLGQHVVDTLAGGSKKSGTIAGRDEKNNAEMGKLLAQFDQDSFKADPGKRGINQHQVGCNSRAASFRDVDHWQRINTAVEAFQQILNIAAYWNLVFDKDYAQSLIHKHHPVDCNNIDPYVPSANKCYLGVGAKTGEACFSSLWIRESQTEVVQLIKGESTTCEYIQAYWIAMSFVPYLTKLHRMFRSLHGCVEHRSGRPVKPHPLL